MKQSSLPLNLSLRKTRKQKLLDDMEKVVPWNDFLALIEPHYPRSHTGRPPFALQTMLRIHLMQQWFELADLSMEEALFDTPIYRDFAGLADGERLPDESTILRFRHLLEKHSLAAAMFETVNALLSAQGLLLKTGSAIDATLIAAPPSTKNKDGKRDPDMHSSKKGNNYHFGMKAHIGVDAESGLVHTVHTTAGNEHDVTQAHQLLHGQEQTVYADSGYRGVQKREEVQNQKHQPQWHIAMMPSKRKALKTMAAQSLLAATLEKIEKLKASIRAKVEHPFRVLKCQFGYRKTRYKGLAKNTAQITTLFALANLWMVRRKLLVGALA
jgi:IS5 family transposase